MKILFDFLPIFLFFAAFKYSEAHKDWAAAFASSQFGFLVAGGVVGKEEAPVLLATVVVIVATLAQVAWLKLRGRKVDTMLWVSLVLVVVLGGATIYFHNETFIKWKPSVLYWAMGLSFWLSPLVFGKNLLRVLLGEQMRLPATVASSTGASLMPTILPDTRKPSWLVAKAAAQSLWPSAYLKAPKNRMIGRKSKRSFMRSAGQS
jgi:intracellular septation protein